MTRKPITDIEEIARRAQSGEDISEHFTGKFVAKQRVNVDFPLALLRAIDAECLLVGIPRQAWIKMACDERLRQIQAGRQLPPKESN
ncbi:MAG: CopG family transcriptional regulator [Acidobacteria bacterium]|nr:CopG family transcriptional regulator [Acidobacteriota bacterium]